jgi:hypothetical protein
MSIASVLVICALIATVVVLGLGLRSMARGGQYDQQHAEKFMWERVALAGPRHRVAHRRGGDDERLNATFRRRYSRTTQKIWQISRFRRVHIVYAYPRLY